jgi:hypothetical protein
MNKPTTVALGLLLATVVLGIAGSAAMAFWWPVHCVNTIQGRLASPDGRHQLVVFERDCGATTDYSTQVSVLGAGEALPDEPGNVYIYTHRVPVRVGWISASETVVCYAPGFRGDELPPLPAGLAVRYMQDGPGPLPCQAV